MSEEGRTGQNSQMDGEPCIILAVGYSGGRLGAAIYEQRCSTIRVLHDVVEDSDFSMINSLISQVSPSIILVNKAQDLQLLRYISNKCLNGYSDMALQEKEKKKEKDSYEEVKEKQSAADEIQLDENSNDRNDDDEYKCDEEDKNWDEEDENWDEEAIPISMHIMPNTAYEFESALKRISELFAEESLNDFENDLILKFRVDVNSLNMVRAFGALLKYMDAVRVGVEFDALNVRTPVSAIKTLVIDEMVEMDFATYRALDIFAEHRKKELGWRRALKGCDSGRVSLFSLCNRCRSTPGKITLRKWFEHPTLNRSTLVKRQSAISYFLQDCHMNLMASIYQNLSKVKSVQMIFRRMKGASAKVAHWKNLYETLGCLVSIGRLLSDADLRLELIEEEMEHFGEILAETTTVIAAIIDFEESKTENRLVVNLGVDPELDETKNLYRKLPAILTDVAQEEANRLQAVSCSVGYVPMVGYLLALPADYPVHLFPDLQVIYSTENAIHVKSNRMNRLDEEMGDVKMQIIDRETTIMLRLQSIVISRSATVLGAVRGAGLLDAAIALAITARQQEWNRPCLVDEPVIDGNNVVHPISQLLSTSPFVANPIKSGGEDTKIKIFTGPNASGKSVYLKQVGIVAFLAHIGSFVPAQRLKIGPINRIMTRMYTVDGVLDGMSTFAKDLSQLAIALRRGNQFSLVIVDEFGKGTMTEVGLSLLASSLSYWISKGRDGCPHIFVSSHLHALSGLLPENSELVSYHALKVLRRGALLDFQYRLVDGIADRSFAAYTASKMGIAEDVVKRSKEVYDHLVHGHRLSDVGVESEEEKKNRWLASRMADFKVDFETWDINDVEGLLNMIETNLFAEDETLDLTKESTVIVDKDGDLPQGGLLSSPNGIVHGSDTDILSIKDREYITPNF